jgi:drug/metabolite transporter (DMT)-like permease
MNTLKTNNKMSLVYIILAVVLCILFGANTVATKISFDGFGVLTAATLRFFISSLMIFLWAAATGHSLKIEKKYFKKVLVLAGIFSVQYFFIFWGISKTTASRSVLLIYLQPFFVLLLSHLLIVGDQINFKKFLGMIIGFCGILPLFILKKDIGANFTTGDFLVLIGAFLWAVNVVYLKSFIQNTSVVAITFYNFLLAVPIFLIGAFIFDPVMLRAFCTPATGALVYQGFATGFGFIAWNFLIKKFQVSVVHSFLFIAPLSGVLLGILLLSEPFTINIFFALILISIGIIITHYSKKTV